MVLYENSMQLSILHFIRPYNILTITSVLPQGFPLCIDFLSSSNAMSTSLCITYFLNDSYFLK